MRESSSTPSKVDYLRREIQQLVSQGIESPRFELTRKCSLAAGDKKSQTDFAKTIQGMANAYPSAERVYVVGADQKEKKFFPVENEREFDPANVRHILEKYLQPVPIFEAWSTQTDDGAKFAAIVLSAEQPRPIVVKTSVQASDGKTQLLQKGDIWVKKQTALDRAGRDDLEVMYETRIEAESESRAAKRFGDMRNGLEASLRLQLSPERRIPSEDLVFGPNAEYKAYIEQLLANQDALRFHMLTTTLHDLMVEKWHSVNAYDPEAPYKAPQFATKVAEHTQNAFSPALRRLVYTGLEVLLAGRLLATYSMRMQRYQYLPALLRKSVTPVSSSVTRTREPFLFWPLRMNVPGNDRIAYAWQHDAQSCWLEFFGSEESYVDAATRLELILHLNSYLATEIPEVSRWLSQYKPDENFQYWYTSDLWRYSLGPAVPLAEKLYESLAMGPDAPFLLDFSVEHGAFQKASQPSGLSGHEQQTFIAYLKKLASWQSEAAFSCGRVPYQTEWGPILAPLIRAKNA